MMDRLVREALGALLHSIRGIYDFVEAFVSS